MCLILNELIRFDEESKKFVVINSPSGTLDSRMVISSASGIFQQVMGGLLQGIEGIIVYTLMTC